MPSSLSPELRHLVNETVALLGEVLKAKLGRQGYQRIERTRESMAKLRQSSQQAAIGVLQKQYRFLESLSPQQQFEFAQSFALMLELMNTCENAYRSHLIKKRVFKKIENKPDAIIYVLTAHPTEARSPHNIRVFQEILKILTKAFERPDTKLLDSEKQLIYHWIEVAWSTSMVRTKKPRVHDEAEHIYLTLLREETLSPLLRAHRELAPIFVRSWVGGDKDGHPGVDEKVFLESLQLSRHLILQFLQRRLNAVLDVIRGLQNHELLAQITEVRHKLKAASKIRKNDGQRITALKISLSLLSQLYQNDVGSLHPALLELKQLIEIFPGLVVPLEFRESSDILISSPTGKGLAIFRMLKTLANISKGGDPRFYVRELIVSMAENITHIRIAAGLVQRTLGQIYIPVVPLFEQAKAQDQGIAIVQEMLNDKKISKAIHKYWKSQLEIMLGYSDSSKESGVLPSRLKVAETMYALDRFCKSKKIIPIFFQGSGGSVDRGGGSIEEQTSWWSSGALRNYKVTIQGEMVERNLANSEITMGQLEQIAYYAGHWKKAEKRSLPKSFVVDNFADKVAKHYQSKIKSEELLKSVEKATPYSFLSLIKIGSRPTKRAKGVSVSSLRAIPWIMCWTQTRILFPVWWGIGSAWEESTASQKKSLQKAYKSHAVFGVYMKALGFTLAKVELPVWKIYLEQSELSAEIKQKLWDEFSEEYSKSLRSFRAISRQKNPLYWRPWLGESIRLRSPMIHPLNLLQIIAMKRKDAALLRVTVAGISSGMMTTG